MTEVITKDLDLWTSALLTKSSAGRGSNRDQEAYGIKKLRELILDLAARGRLLPQDPKDEPASVLLDRIAKAKARLIKEGKIRKEKPLPEIENEERDYELPVGWAFVRLGDVAFSQAGFAFKSRFFNESGEGLPLIRIRDVGQVLSGTYYSGEFREEFLVQNGDYLIGMDGDFRVAPWTNGAALLNQRVSRLIFFDESVGKRFIADSLQARLRELQGIKAYTTVDHLSGTQIAQAVIGLPPLAEQHRIVAKVDELMALCDQMEQQQTHSIEAHQTLVETLLGTLTRAASPQELTEAWARVASHFDVLFTTGHSIDLIKRAILQLAVMGKLVPADSVDEPASALLTRIAQEKAERLEASGNGGHRQYAEIDGTEKLFATPASWQWVRLGVLFNVIVDCPHSTPKFVDSGFLCLDTNSFKQGALIESKFRYVDADTYSERTARLAPDEGDIVFAREGSVGESVVLPPGIQCCLGQRVMLFRPSKRLNSEFLRLAISSPRSLEALLELHKGIGAKHVNVADMRNFAIALPPAAEQHRIVAKVVELMALCDGLETRINTAQATQVHLADVIVEQAIA